MCDFYIIKILLHNYAVCCSLIFFIISAVSWSGALSASVALLLGNRPCFAACCTNTWLSQVFCWGLKSSAKLSIDFVGRQG